MAKIDKDAIRIDGTRVEGVLSLDFEEEATGMGYLRKRSAVLGLRLYPTMKGITYKDRDLLRGYDALEGETLTVDITGKADSRAKVIIEEVLRSKYPLEPPICTDRGEIAEVFGGNESKAPRRGIIRVGGHIVRG